MDIVSNEDGSVTLETKECNNLKVALEFAEKGAPITKEQHCGGCINGYFKAVAKNLGMNLMGEFTDKGCKMTIRK